jgi:GntR family transcriptional regulator
MSAGRYGEIADNLRRRIHEGEWAPETNLPRMVDLAEEFGVNRHTIARAISELESEGLVWAVPHRGTIVRPRDRRRITRGNIVKRNRRHIVDGKETAGGYSFPAAAGTERWINHVTAVASLEILDNPRLAEMLKVPVGSPILRRHRVTGPPGEAPFQMSNTWIHPRGVKEAPRG